MSYTLPPRRRYKLAAREQQETLLPFVRYLPSRNHPHYWQMPTAAENYAIACAYGRECAAHLLQWLKDNPEYVGSGLLSRVARDIDFDDHSQRGHWMGFFNYLEHMLWLGARRVRVYRHLDNQHQLHDAQTLRAWLEARRQRHQKRPR